MESADVSWSFYKSTSKILTAVVNWSNISWGNMVKNSWYESVNKNTGDQYETSEKSHDAGSNDLLLTIIIPCYNSSQFIRRTVSHILMDIHRHVDTKNSCELVLVDNNSSDDTLTVLNSLASENPEYVKVICENTKGVSAARNAGANNSSGTYLLFIDHDDIVLPGLVKSHLDAARLGIEFTCGSNGDFEESKQSLDDVYFGGLHQVRRWLPYAEGSNLGMKADIFKNLGGFDMQFQGGEDADLSWRAQLSGVCLTFLPDARLLHIQRTNTIARIKQFKGYGRGEVRLFVKFRKLGMPRSSVARAAVSVIGSIAEIMLVPLSNGNINRAVSRISLHYGRLLESVRDKVLYL